MKCSNCSSDLTHSEWSMDWRLELSATQMLPPENKKVMDVRLNPLLDQTHSFCGLGCLHKWVEEEIAR